MEPSRNPGLRVSDDDRNRVVAALERHTAAGRLTLDEFAERAARAHASVTHRDLALVTADLPADTGPATPVSRQLLVAFLVALAALTVLFTVLALAK